MMLCCDIVLNIIHFVIKGKLEQQNNIKHHKIHTQNRKQTLTTQNNTTQHKSNKIKSKQNK